jgi:hypothetical protein
VSGRHTFGQEEIVAIRAQLRRLRVSEREEQKKIRAGLRRIGFRISDYATDSVGFTVSDFDSLVARGVIHSDSGPAMPPTPAPEAAAPGPGPAPQSRSPGRQPRNVAKDAKVDAIAALTFPRHTIAICLAGAVPDQPGLYAMYGNASVWRVLELGEPPDDRPLYVGKAEDSLAARDLNAHFATGATGRSSPRRSFAALLATELRLIAIPRRAANPEPGVDPLFAGASRRSEAHRVDAPAPAARRLPPRWGWNTGCNRVRGNGTLSAATQLDWRQPAVAGPGEKGASSHGRCRARLGHRSRVMTPARTLRDSSSLPARALLRADRNRAVL